VTDQQALSTHIREEFPFMTRPRGRLRAAVVGTGAIAHGSHLPALADHAGEVELVAAVDVNTAQLDAFRAAAGDGVDVLAGEGEPGRGAARIGYVAADDREGARDMVRYLHASGRRRIATVSGPPDTPGGVERLAGYRETLAECGLPADDLLIATGDYSRASGEQAAELLLQRAPDLDAVFVASDLMAQGVLDALTRAGRRVPEDIAVGGFDDSPAALSSRPRLTTIRQPWDRISKEMVRMLLARIGGEEPAALILPTELVRRDSA
jgi:DNA-binding LacI/PurR family transcriptional regulator